MFFIDILIFYIECGCNEIGTMSIIGSAILDCDKTTGYCNCSEGYSGSKCDKCATDYYDTTNGNSQTPTCAGTNSKLKWSFNPSGILGKKPVLPNQR